MLIFIVYWTSNIINSRSITLQKLTIVKLKVNSETLAKLIDYLSEFFNIYLQRHCQIVTKLSQYLEMSQRPRFIWTSRTCIETSSHPRHFIFFGSAFDNVNIK